jgi:hypothetical protein
LARRWRSCGRRARARARACAARTPPWTGRRRGRHERSGWNRAAAGGRLDDLELQAIVGKAIVTRDRAAAAAAAGRPLGLTGDEVLASPHFLVGTAGEMADDLVRRRERWGISYWTLSSGNVAGGNDMRGFAEVIRRAGR